MAPSQLNRGCYFSLKFSSVIILIYLGPWRGIPIRMASWYANAGALHYLPRWLTNLFFVILFPEVYESSLFGEWFILKGCNAIVKDDNVILESEIIQGSDLVLQKNESYKTSYRDFQRWSYNGKTQHIPWWPVEIIHISSCVWTYNIGGYSTIKWDVILVWYKV